MRRFNIDKVNPGVYFLFLEGKLVYIGQSKHPELRILQHRHNSYKYHDNDFFDSAYIFEVSAEDLDTYEGALIRHFKPELNRNVRGYMHCPIGDPDSDERVVSEIAPLLAKIESDNR